MTSLSTAALALAAALTVAAHSDDWLKGQGPNRDGAIAQFTEPATWPAALAKRWQVEVGVGAAAPVVVGERVYVFSREGDEEVLRAVDAGRGTQLWRAAYPAVTANSAAAASGAGPLSTPAFGGGRLFTVGTSGVVLAFDASEGRVLWQFAAPAAPPARDNTVPPLADGTLLIVHVSAREKGALTAFEAATGKVAWQWSGDGLASGALAVGTLAGVRQVIAFAGKHFIGVDRDSGALLWRRASSAAADNQTPLVHNDMVIEPGGDGGIAAFRPTLRAGTWATTEVWRTKEVSVAGGAMVADDGVAYGLARATGGRYFALDLDTGKILWQSDPAGARRAAIARAGRILFSLEDQGELAIMRASRSGVEPVKRYKLATAATPTEPVVSGRRIFVKNGDTLTLWTID